jgi:hypothetical protein
MKDVKATLGDVWQSADINNADMYMLGDKFSQMWYPEILIVAKVSGVS